MIKKVCTKCGKKKSIEEFRQHKGYKDGYETQCNDCKREYHKRWYRKNKEHHCSVNREYHLNATYGISSEQYDIMFKRQKGRCAICGHKETRIRSEKVMNLVVDHDHNTDKIRELLCTKCNVVIGMAADNQDILAKAIRYLKKHSR